VNTNKSHRFCFLFVFSLFFGGIEENTLAAQSDSALNRLRALGQAYMEEEDFPHAIETYSQATALAPASASDLVNLGIAYYHGDKNEEAIRTLEKSLKLDAENVFAFYTLGLANKKIGESTQALEYFQRVAEKDATDAAVNYNVGLALSKIGRADDAVPWFERTIKIDPNHSSSYYQLMMHATRSRQREKALELQKKFRDLKSAEEQRPPDAVDEGKFLGPIEFEIPREDLPNFTSDLAVRLVRNNEWSQSIADAIQTDHGRFLAVIPDLIQKQTDLIIACENGTYAVSLASDASVMQTRLLTSTSEWRGCAFADYDNDENIDLLFYSGERTVLLRNEGSWQCTDVSETIGLHPGGSLDAVWADFDHEGDLDLLLAGKDSAHFIYQNNGDGSFTNVSGKVEGLEFEAGPAIVFTDLDNDNDLDFIRIDKQNRLEIFSNLRQSRFTKVHEHVLPGPVNPSENIKILCRDFDHDGKMDIILTNVSSDRFSREDSSHSIVYKVNPDWTLTPSKPFMLESDASQQIRAVFDANNDGFEDILLDCDGGESPSLFLNQFPLSLQANSHPIPTARLSSAIAADLDFDGDLDVAAVSTEGKYLLLENLDGNQNHWISMKIKGNKNSKDGYGSKIMIKDDLFRQKHEITSSFIHLGLGNRDQVDVIRITWPNGIFQNVIHAAADQILAVTEKPGYVGSCAFVYSWNGKQFEFIADSLCTAPIGLYVGGGYFPPDPEEYIRIRGDQLRAKNGELDIRIREELREILYFDEAEMISVTHPPEIEVYANERFTTPPFPEFQLIGMSPNARPPRRAFDNHGNDVAELLSINDNQYPRPFTPGRYTGIGEEHWFELDLGDLGDAKTIYLFMTGYVDWPSSSEALALEQNPSLDFVMPYLQVKNKKGEWETVRDPMGFPAGKLKTVPLDISDIFLTDDRCIRIVSTLQIHWDRILVDTSPVLTPFTITNHPLISADLRYGGYSQSYDLAGRGPTWYDYGVRTTNSRWDYQTGLFTRFGDVLSLLRGFDDRYVIMQHGDEIALRFQAAKEPSNQATTYFLRVVGWVKDADHITAHGSTVEPLPFKAMSIYPYGRAEHYPLDEEHLQYLLEYNTRTFANPNESAGIPKLVSEF
jgi:tetratricopeptide (TPR) repeat protein